MTVTAYVVATVFAYFYTLM